MKRFVTGKRSSLFAGNISDKERKNYHYDPVWRRGRGGGERKKKNYAAFSLATSVAKSQNRR